MKISRIKMTNENFINLVFAIVMIGLMVGASVKMYDKLQTNINAQIEAQVNLRVQESVKQFKTEYKANRSLYKAIYTSSFKQQDFYFQTNKNPFEIAKKYLPDKWTGLKIEKVTKIENNKRRVKDGKY